VNGEEAVEALAAIFGCRCEVAGHFPLGLKPQFWCGSTAGLKPAPSEPMVGVKLRIGKPTRGVKLARSNRFGGGRSANF
jgi:hypothetical protein